MSAAAETSAPAALTVLGETAADPVAASPALPLEAYGLRESDRASRLMWGVCWAVAALTAIAAFAPIHKVALADGQIQPDAALVPADHPEGGVVSEILAQPGARVAAGQTILRLRPAGATADFNQAEARRIGLALTKERLTALLESRAPDFAALLGPAPNPELAARAIQERALFDSERGTNGAAALTLRARLDQRRAELIAVGTELASLQNQRAINAEQLAMREGLLAEGLATREAVLEARLAVRQADTRIAAAQGQAAALRAGIVQAEAELNAGLADQRRQWSLALSQTATELAALEAQHGKLGARVAALEVKAPVAGVIQDLNVRAPGVVAAPGQPLATIVPVDAPLFAEVRLRPEDVGEVQLGQAARLSVSAFESDLYGELVGAVRSISPSTIETERGDRFYRAVIAFDRPGLERNGALHPVSTGMAVQAQIVTGQRTLLSHLLRPIDRAMERAFTQ